MSDVYYMFRNSWVHPQGDSCICSMVCFTCIGVSSLSGQESGFETLTHYSAHTDACKTCHTAYKSVSLRMNHTRFETCSRRQKLNIDL